MAGMQQNLSYHTTFHISTRLGTRDAYTGMMPGHPTFGYRDSSGYNVGNTGFEEFLEGKAAVGFTSYTLI